MKSVSQLVSDYYKAHCVYLWSTEGKGGASITLISCNRQVFVTLVPTVVLWQFRQEL